MAERIGPGGFLLRAVLWLVPAFALWAACGPWLAAGLAAPLEWLLKATWPVIFRAVESSGHDLDIVTHLGAGMLPSARPGPGGAGEIVLSVDALKYSYGLPLLLGLCLAVPEPLLHRLRRFAIGAPVLLPVVLWGIYWEALTLLLFRLGDAVSAAVAAGAVMQNFAVLAYQLGFLIFPPVSAALVWGWRNADFLRGQMAAQRGSVVEENH